MPVLSVYDTEGKKVDDLALSEEVFGADPNRPLLHQAVVAYLANQRTGTAFTKTRGEVRGGGRKPWRQKGTGRARHGSRRSPIWRKGGIVFGPRPREYRIDLPKKAKRKALISALSAKVKAEEVRIVDRLELPEPKTKELVGILDKLGVAPKVLIVTADGDERVVRSARNLKGVKAISADSLNPYQILNARYMVITRAAAAKIEEALRG